MKRPKKSVIECGEGHLETAVTQAVSLLRGITRVTEHQGRLLVQPPWDGQGKVPPPSRLLSVAHARFLLAQRAVWEVEESEGTRRRVDPPRDVVAAALEEAALRVSVEE